MKEGRPSLHELIQLYRIVQLNEQGRCLGKSTELFTEEDAHQAKVQFEQAGSDGMSYRLHKVALNLDFLATLTTKDTVLLLYAKSIEPVFFKLPLVIYRHPDLIESYLHRVLDSNLYLVDEEAFMGAKQIRFPRDAQRA